MSSTRSGRKKTVIDYAKFNEGSDEDDFKECTPPKKKPKQEKGAEKRKKEDPTEDSKVREDRIKKEKPLEENRKDVSPENKENLAEEKKRVSVTEKIFQRDLEKALHLSQTNVEKAQEDPVAALFQDSDESDGEESQSASEAEDSDYDKPKKKSSRRASSGEEEFDYEKPKKKSSKRVSSDEEESDYEKPKKKSKPAPKKSPKKISVKASTSVKSPQKVEQAPGTTKTTCAGVSQRSSPRVDSNLAAIHRAIIQPVQLPQSRLRVGLSRNLRVAKPLHPNVKIT